MGIRWALRQRPRMLNGPVISSRNPITLPAQHRRGVRNRKANCTTALRCASSIMEDKMCNFRAILWARIMFTSTERASSYIWFIWPPSQNRPTRIALCKGGGAENTTCGFKILTVICRYVKRTNLARAQMIIAPTRKYPNVITWDFRYINAILEAREPATILTQNSTPFLIQSEIKWYIRLHVHYKWAGAYST